MSLGQISEQNLKNTATKIVILSFSIQSSWNFFSSNCVRLEKHIYLLGFLAEGITANNMFCALDLPQYCCTVIKYFYSIGISDLVNNLAKYFSEN